MERTCKQCGGTFTLTPEEIAFYQSKNLQLPKRCEQCRKENKAKTGYTPAQQTVRPYYGKKKESGKRWAAAAAVLVLLIAGIGIFQSGRLFERDATGKVQEISAETAAGSPEADVSTEDAEFGYKSADEYLEGANRVIASSEALHKLEAEDGDDVYYLEATNEFVIVSTDGYLRTYFKPEDGKAYYDRQ